MIPPAEFPGYPIGNIRVYDRPNAEVYQLRPRAEIVQSSFVLARPKPRRRKMSPKSGPVTVTRVNPGVWATALDLAGGDPTLLRIINLVTVEVLDGRYR